MKTNYTFSIIRTFALTSIAAIATLNLSGQTRHMVSVTDYKFTPSTITINVGDIVEWTNTGAMGHNVNGTQVTFPNNPESFGNTVGLDWTFEHTFNTAGTYDYHCDPHAAFGMTGQVIVNPATAVEELAGGNKAFTVFPNPASQYIDLMFNVDYGKASTLKIYNLNGALVDQKILPQNALSYRYELNRLKSGLYFIELNGGTKTNVLKFIKQ